MGMALKDYLTLIISTAALFVSLITAYFTFRHIDDVRMILPDMNDLAIRMKIAEDRLSVAASQNITFINSGNRAAAITRVVLMKFGPFEGDETKCQVNMDTLNYDFEPVVIKPGEILMRKVKLSDTQQSSVVSSKDGILPFDSNTIKPAMFLFCLSINIETPDSLLRDIRVPLVKWTMFLNPQQFDTATLLFDRTKSVKIFPPHSDEQFDPKR
jgi:hypothetical protein